MTSLERMAATTLIATVSDITEIRSENAAGLPMSISTSDGTWRVTAVVKDGGVKLRCANLVNRTDIINDLQSGRLASFVLIQPGDEMATMREHCLRRFESSGQPAGIGKDDEIGCGDEVGFLNDGLRTRGTVIAISKGSRLCQVAHWRDDMVSFPHFEDGEITTTQTHKFSRVVTTIERHKLTKAMTPELFANESH